MYDTGLFLNDLSLHDASRDLVLVGDLKSAELKIALDQVRLLLSCIKIAAGGLSDLLKLFYLRIIQTGLNSRIQFSNKLALKQSVV